VNIAYTGATTGTNNYVSAVIEDSGGTVLYYGKLADTASGTAGFNVPASLADGNYTIRLFTEEANGDDFTDFASLPIDIQMTVDNTAPILAAGAVSRTNHTNATVDFTSTEAGTYFYQIDGTAPTAASLVTAGTNSAAMTSGANTITLTNLTAGQRTIYIASQDAVGNVSNMLNITIPAYVPPTYTLTVTGGTGGGNFEADATVNITANAPPAGQQFKEWVISPAVTFVQGTSATTPNAEFIMPAQAVTATATFEPIPPGNHLITVTHTGIGVPQTGDDRSLILPILALIISVLCITAAAFYIRRIKKLEH